MRTRPSLLPPGFGWHMLLLLALFLLALAGAACSTPTQASLAPHTQLRAYTVPSCTTDADCAARYGGDGSPASYVPKHHGIPATFVGEEAGPIVWLCATQLRDYGGTLEEDHYLQHMPCPRHPIP